ncbi:MAG: DUF4878 domain-containing protein [Bacillota bacterium]|nr:DUF4878 domain-containing protein [Bacillota bacterium]
MCKTKRLSSVLIALILVFCLAGCGSSSKPADTVKGFLDSAKTMDFTKMSTYINPSNSSKVNDMNTKITSDSVEKNLLDYLKTQSSKMTYEIKSSNISGNSATVTVNCKYIDGSPFLKEVVAEYVKEAFASAFSGSQNTDEQTNTLLKNIIGEKQKSVTDTYKESSIDIKCVKINNIWYIDSFEDSLANAVTSNFLEAGKEIASAFSNTTPNK